MTETARFQNRSFLRNCMPIIKHEAQKLTSCVTLNQAGPTQWKNMKSAQYAQGVLVHRMACPKRVNSRFT